MDTVSLYRVVEAVERSLAAAGLQGFALSLADRPGDWFFMPWLYDFLKDTPHRRILFLWEGNQQPAFETLCVDRGANRQRIRRCDQDGIVVVRELAVVAAVYALSKFGSQFTVMVVGEREPGALRELLDEYTVYASRRARTDREIHVVGGDPISRPPGLTWEHLVAPADVREELRRQVDGFFAAREAYDRMGLPYRRGVLLTGPPGNGKTTVLRVVASQRPEPMVLLSRREDTDQDLLDQAFDRALSYAPSILCFEDVDSLFDNRIPLSHFLNRLDGISSLEGILLFATTNHPEKLDGALTERPSRFDRVFVLGNPAADERRAYLRERFGSSFDDRLVDWTDGFSMAQVKEVWVSCCLDAIETGAAGLSVDTARRAAQRLGGQKESIEREGHSPGPIGFQARRCIVSSPRPPRALR